MISSMEKEDLINLMDRYTQEILARDYSMETESRLLLMEMSTMEVSSTPKDTALEKWLFKTVIFT
jgi:hypothetical protein